nr:MAG TPA: hypothetical protein [Caudoviricetes sp.]
MEAKEIMSKFDELYGMMASSTNVKYMHTFGDTMRCMMKDMAAKHPELAEEYLNKLCAIKWKNYLTKKEASEIVNGMNPSAAWDMQTWISAMNGLGLATEEKPYYNDYALYVAMNQVASDHGSTIAKILGKEDVKEIGTEHLVKYAHCLALDLLKDKDGVYDIREYFLK